MTNALFALGAILYWAVIIASAVGIVWCCKRLWDLYADLCIGPPEAPYDWESDDQ